MLSRALCMFSLFLLTVLSGLGQEHSERKSACLTPTCTESLPLPPGDATRATTKWEAVDKSATEASIPCAVVGYVSDGKPQVHLLCPGPQIFAPLRVLLALTWMDAKDVPASMKNSRLDMNAAVRFKSKPGRSLAELTLRDADARAQKEWVSFNKVAVSLVLEPSK